MISWKCPECHRNKETENDVVMVVCKCCQVKMSPLKNSWKSLKRKEYFKSVPKKRLPITVFFWEEKHNEHRRYLYN